MPTKRRTARVSLALAISRTNGTHHDALEFPDGRIVLLTRLVPGQRATVLQLPAQPRSEAEAQEQTRVEVVA
jgi:hypothetical protein